ncbi:hypothetical protein [Halococcoides cellulosivorans]|uniref:Uncharacterized protein n=1 Tax=Halococcoides cellulosivorans TaxID=1679096 RepID=A0A2R4X1S3_9EURY|nr:hypothetical protein [Halococcoides cellulosivorans]AWB27750.1 hypothetical protein HARCEL1_08515 [Halococcoides cellulosivorans]
MDPPPADGRALVALVVLAALVNGLGVLAGRPVAGGVAALAVGLVGAGLLYWRSRVRPTPEA